MELDPVLAALRLALETNARQPALWMHYADLLRRAGREAAAIEALRSAEQVGAPADEVGRNLIPLLRQHGHLAEALIRADQILERGDDPEIRAELERILAARRGEAEAPPEAAKEAKNPDSPETRVQTPLGRVAVPIEHDDTTNVSEWAKQFDWGDLHTGFADVVGLEDVKRAIRLKIIAPFQKQEIFSAFGRKAGGGILLYGPPGCGKTFLARATAGECQARFVIVGIHDVLDKYYGESEKFVHGLFEEARRRTPTVLFFDEFDALAGGRGGTTSQFYKTLTDQILQEMDGAVASNEGVLVFAATNVPWHIDAAFRRPGRFDRTFFVPPPDEAARGEMLARRLAKLPGAKSLDAKKLIRKTALFTGADLEALCERAAERALERSLETDEVHPVTQADLERELARMTSSAEEWLATARNYASYGNQGGQYDELRDYLRSIKRL
ncbi:MAG: AAA family ATPase [Planctomycetota bacterium]